jgi:hypothetical protein
MVAAEDGKAGELSENIHKNQLAVKVEMIYTDRPPKFRNCTKFVDWPL